MPYHITPVDYSYAPTLATRLRERARQMTAPAVTAIGLILGGLLIAEISVGMDPYFAIAGTVCLAAGIVVAFKPQLGIFIYFLIAPFAIGSSPEVTSRNTDYGAGLLPSQIVLGFLLLMWVGRMAVKGKYELLPSEMNKPMFALGGVVVASFLCSQVIYNQTIPEAHHLLITQMAEMGLFLLAIGAFLLAANTLKSARVIQALIVPVMLIGLYVCIVKLTDVPMVVPTTQVVLMASIAAAYALAKLLFNRPKGMKAVVLAVVLALCVFLALRAHSWISGLIAISFAVLTLVYMKSRRMFVWGVIALVLLALGSTAFLSSMVVESEEQGDFDRFGIWRDAASMAIDTNPVLGIGPGNFYPYSFRFGTIWYGRHTYSTAHNNYAQVGAEMGLLGLAALFWLIFTGVKTGFKLFRETRADLKWVPAAATAIFISFAASSTLGDYMFPNRANGGLFHFGISVYIWLTMGAAVAAHRLGIEQASEPTNIIREKEVATVV